VVLTIGVEGASRIANTLGWRATIEKYPPALSLGRLFAARLAGEAIDYITPSAQLGGQFVMALMVRHKLPMAVGLATVVVAAFAETIGQIGFIVIALTGTLRLFAALHDVVWLIVGGLAITVALAAGFLWVQTKQPFSRLSRAAAKLNLPGVATPEMRNASAEADALLSDFYSRHRMRLLISTLWYLIAWAMGPVEIYILMIFLKQPVSIAIVLLIEALGLLLERVTFMIPAKLVSQEGGKALIMGMLGYPPGAGFSIGLLRRIKEMAWVLFGLGCLTVHRLTEAELISTGPKREAVVE
jgi:uncharacterized membrane protein YbhN (UPF0104 family)